MAGPAIAGSDALLDVGCGAGWWLASLAARGVDATRLFGLDAAPARVEAARKRAPGATVLVGDGRRLPWEDDRFGAVFLLLVLSSLPDAEAVGATLAEARRVLAPGGTLVIWEPRVPTPWNGQTRWIRRRELLALLGRPETSCTLTVVPAVARRLGRSTRRWYPILARVNALRTHRVSAWRAPG